MKQNDLKGEFLAFLREAYGAEGAAMSERQLPPLEPLGRFPAYRNEQQMGLLPGMESPVAGGFNSLAQRGVAFGGNIESEMAQAQRILLGG